MSRKDRRDKKNKYGPAGGFPNTSAFIGQAGSAHSPSSILAAAASSQLGAGEAPSHAPKTGGVEAIADDGLSSAPAEQVVAAATELVADSAKIEVPDMVGGIGTAASEPR